MNQLSYNKYDHFFLDTIINNFPIKNKKICVAVSGGLDSMVLLNLLLHIPNTILGVAHCNFALRNKESNKDEDFVKKFCLKNHITYHIKRFNTFDFSKKQKLSIQMSARKLRYDWFNELLKNSYELIALGHHFNDSIETFFINLMRGTGIKGLLGIPKKNGKFIRPLSSFTKEEILSYAKKRNLNWRLDKSNLDDKYLRNKIRSVISVFSFSFKGIKKSIDYLHQENFLIEKQIQEINKKITVEKKYNPFYWKISCNQIMNLQPLSFYLFKLFFSYGFSNHIKSLKNLLYAQSGKQLISKKYRIIKNRNFWILISNSFLFANKNKVFLIPNIIKNNDYSRNLSLPVNVKFSFHTEIEKNKPMISFIDFDKIQFPLKLRTWKEGDYFYPINMKGKKKLSKYYKEKKFSLLEKEQTWLLVNGNEDIILVLRNRLDDRFKVTEKTKKILGIKI
ncbi:tRNA lysidine(34) synthetase TilS [Blattabacterium cuenoti]|uniref:tRNA lysidine(34) synthetase TilS n=1 Tax=Blattabacterium cuenoti TaxID=1653831 RepID=UPI00163C344B|nr:tRNA lysidine(34) synthetase TilS [Blattabacterium cuenoti]